MQYRNGHGWYWPLILILTFGACKTNQPGNTTATQEQVLLEMQRQDSLAMVADTLETAEAIDTTRLPEAYQAARKRVHNLIHTKLELSFDWEKQHVLGKASLELSPHFYPQNTVTLDAKGFDIHAIALLDDDESRQALGYDYDGLKLIIQLPRTYTREESIFLSIDYTAKPNEIASKGSAAITSDKGLYFINPLREDGDKPQQIWTQGETEANSKWFPTIDAPNQKTTQEMYITVEERFKTLSNGLLVYSSINEDGTRTDYWKMDLPHAPYLFMMAIGEFAVVEDTWNDITVDYYVEPEYEQYAKDIFGNTPEMISFFSEKLDYKFPWPKYSQVIVRDYVSGAMENTTASIFMDALQVNDRELLDSDWDGIIAHELFHQWFGDLVTCESWSNLPLNEAFANYSEYLWAEYKHGKDEADYENMQEMQGYLREASQKQVDLIRFYYDDKEDMFDNHSYAKGGRILHMLRNYVGDEAFFASLSQYLKMHDFTAVEVHDLRLAFENVTGEDLNWFFNQWFLNSGHPILEVSYEYQEGTLLIDVAQKQDFETTPVYKLPLYVDVWIDGKKERFSVEVNRPKQQIAIELDTEPTLVVFDGDQQLLAEINQEISRENYLLQYQHSDQFLLRYKAIEAIGDDVRETQVLETLLVAMEDPAWAIRQMAVAAFADYIGEHQQRVVEKLRSIALDDEKSLVRADAIAVLASIDADEHMAIFEEGLKNPSYAVVGASLSGYAATAATNKDEIINSLASEENINIVIPLADYFISEADPARAPWFEGKLQTLSGADLYYMLQYYGQFLMAVDDDGVHEQAVLQLEMLVLHHEQYYIRLAAFQALMMMDGYEPAETLMQKAAAEEKDPRLQQYYQSMFADDDEE